MTSFSVHCTLPEVVTNYVSGPDTRGTVDILWTAITIFILCTWSIQHPNVPLQSRPQNRMQKFKRKLYLFLAKTLWMGWNLLAPEYMIGKAMSDLMSARYHQKELGLWAEKDGSAWSLAHAFYANMGGFMIRFTEETACSPDVVRENNTLKSPLGGNTAEIVGDAHATFEEGTEALPQMQSDHERCTKDHPSTLVPTVVETVRGNEPNTVTIASKQQDGRTLEETGNREDDVSSVSDTACKREGLATDGDKRGRRSRINKEGETQVVRFNSKIPDRLRRVILYGPIGIDSWPKRCKLLRRHFGNIDWQIDPWNRDIVLAALQDLDPSNLRGRNILTWLTTINGFQGDIWIPDAAQLLYARERGIISSLPSLSPEQLDDQNKSSFMVKAITLMQVGWLIIEVIVRKTEGLPSAQIEIVALAFAVCSFFTYLLLWGKPQDVQFSTQTTAARRPRSDEIMELGMIGPFPAGSPRMGYWIPNDHVHMQGRDNTKAPILILNAGLITGAALFGALHCIAWNSSFPTDIEQTLWRVACLLSSCGAPVGGLAVEGTNRMVHRLNAGRPSRLTSIVSSTMMTIVWVPYLLCRLYISVEIFRALCFLPPDAYKATDWPNYLPHAS